MTMQHDKELFFFFFFTIAPFATLFSFQLSIPRHRINNEIVNNHCHVCLFVMSYHHIFLNGSWPFTDAPLVEGK